MHNLGLFPFDDTYYRNINVVHKLRNIFFLHYEANVFISKLKLQYIQKMKNSESKYYFKAHRFSFKHFYAKC